jgi:hypothetical protein
MSDIGFALPDTVAECDQLRVALGAAMASYKEQVDRAEMEVKEQRRRFHERRGGTAKLVARAEGIAAALRAEYARCRLQITAVKAHKHTIVARDRSDLARLFVEQASRVIDQPTMQRIWDLAMAEHAKLAEVRRDSQPGDAVSPANAQFTRGTA